MKNGKKGRTADCRVMLRYPDLPAAQTTSLDSCVRRNDGLGMSWPIFVSMKRDYLGRGRREGKKMLPPGTDQSCQGNATEAGETRGATRHAWRTNKKAPTGWRGLGGGSLLYSTLLYESPRPLAFYNRNGAIFCIDDALITICHSSHHLLFPMYLSQTDIRIRNTPIGVL